MRYNYHTHTERCQHAKGKDEEFVLAAIETGYDEMGFSDHSPWPYEGGFVSHIRMPDSEFKAYSESINALKEKYKDKISIKLGLECEYFPKYFPWLKEKIEEYGVDYIILGHHFCDDEKGRIYNGDLTEKAQIERFGRDIVDALEEGSFSYVAHPDLFLKNYPVFDETCEKVSRAIIEKAVETRTPLEYNLLGVKYSIAAGRPGYPNPEFWRIAAEYKPLTVIGIDAHKPDSYREIQLYREAEAFLDSLGLERAEGIRFFR